MLIVQKKNKSKYENFSKCNVCKSRKIKKIFNLGRHTPADTFLNSKDIDLPIDEVDLNCYFCGNCLNIQLKKTINQNIKYNITNYSYSSSNSKKSKTYLTQYFQIIERNFKKKQKKVLEIGANDGFLIKKFKQKRNILYSCEASKYWSIFLKKIGIKTINRIFEKVPNSFIAKHQNSFDLIIANNVFNHTHNARKFFFNLFRLINENGLIFIEVPYSNWMIQKKKFELVYLEHINYFNLSTFEKLCNDNKLYINNFYFTDYHGKMLRIIISKKKNKFNYKKILSQERKYYNKKNLFKHFQMSLNNRKLNFIKKLKKLKKINRKVIAIGASAKTSSVLNFFGLDNKDILFVTDNSKHKIGKFFPNKKIPIKRDEDLAKIKGANIFFSTWNISDFVKKKILRINKSIKIIKY